MCAQAATARHARPVFTDLESRFLLSAHCVESSQWGYAGPCWEEAPAAFLPQLWVGRCWHLLSLTCGVPVRSGREATPPR